MKRQTNCRAQAKGHPALCKARGAPPIRPTRIQYTLSTETPRSIIWIKPHDFYPYPAMLPLQVHIAFITRAKRSQTHPADMSPTTATGHVVAPLSLLYGRLALGTVLDAQLPLDPLERLVAS
jgi:hypothetical protein